MTAGGDGDLLTVGSAGLALGLVALAAFGRRRARRWAGTRPAADGTKPGRRIDVVAIDEAASPAHPEDMDNAPARANEGS